MPDMIERIRCSLRTLLDLQTGAEHLTVLEEDTFLVSYPKSGNTWLRFLVGHLVSPTKPVTFADLERRVPDIYANRDRALRRIPQPRFLKSHEPFTPKYHRVIYLVRDPRDVAVSYYHHQIKFRKITECTPIETFVHRYVRGEVDPYGQWGQHVGSWLGARRFTEGFLCLRYEDLHAALVQQLRKVGAFLQLDTSEIDFQTIADSSSFQRMTALEADESDLWKATRGTRKSISFVRTGKAGGWRNELPESAKRLIKEAWPRQMQALGYAD